VTRLGEGFLWAVLFGSLFFSGKNVVSINFEKPSWATLWGIFSQTHLVTLTRANPVK
jgi:hypothetical protein